MSECYIQEASSRAWHKCDDCGEMFKGDALDMISDIQERLTPRAIVPSGQCPECGALCYELARGESEELYCMPKLEVNSLKVRKAIKKHIEHYGDQSLNKAFDILVEEMAELIVEIAHFRRGRRQGLADIDEEVADVLLALRMYAYISEDEWNIERIMNSKADRFRQRVGDTEAE